MHAFNSNYKNALILALKMLAQLFLGALFIIWLNHPSINFYYQQKYHAPSPLEIFNTSSAWNLGEKITNNLNQSLYLFIKNFQEPTEVKKEEEKTNKNALVKQNPSSSLPILSSTKNEIKKVLLSADNLVFFAGDSLMQGISPHAKIFLHKRFAISSIDLAKQSTGLTYRGFFDWVKTIEETLAKNPKIALLVVMFGPNDPWNFPSEKGQPYLRFGTEAWDAAYRARVAAILDAAKARNVRVIWIGAPVVRDEKLSSGMNHLNLIYEREVHAHGQIFIDANALLGYKNTAQNTQFNEMIEETSNGESKSIKARTGDGIHFMPVAQRRFAEKVVSFIDAKRIDQKEELMTESTTKATGK